MADCGLKGILKNYPVDLLEYNDGQSTITVGLDSALVEYKELVEVTVTAENLGLPNQLVLKGVVTAIAADEQDHSNKSIVTVLTLQSSREEFRQMRAAVDRRQQEVLSFFKKARGLE